MTKEQVLQIIQRNKERGFVPCHYSQAQNTITFEPEDYCTPMGKAMYKGVEIDVYRKRVQEQAAWQRKPKRSYNKR